MTTSRHGNILYKVYRLYADGFRQMRLGRVLWTIILIKLFVIFVVLKLFFFPDVVKQKAQEHGQADDRAAYVAGELLRKSACNNE